MSCPGCDTSSTTYTRCNPPISTNCVFYQGQTLNCPSDSTFTVCKGENMSDVQKIIFDKICALSGKIDVTSIQFPCSLQTAWASQDKTILNLLEYMIDIQCQQNTAISTINSQLPTLDPIVSVCLKCCDDSACGTTQLLLSEALNKIVECLCKTITKAEDALKMADTALSQSTNAINLYSQLEEKVCVLNAQMIQIVGFLNMPPPGINAGISLTPNCPS